VLNATLKSLLAHKLRLALTALAVVLGVMFMAGTFVLTDTIKHSINGLINQGTAGKSALFIANAAEVTRQYDEVNTVPMATHAEAVSGSALLGQTVVKVDYSGYQMQLISGPMKASASH